MILNSVRLISRCGTTHYHLRGNAVLIVKRLISKLNITAPSFKKLFVCNSLKYSCIQQMMLHDAKSYSPCWICSHPKPSQFSAKNEVTRKTLRGNVKIKEKKNKEPPRPNIKIFTPSSGIPPSKYPPLIPKAFPWNPPYTHKSYSPIKAMATIGSIPLLLL